MAETGTVIRPTEPGLSLGDRMLIDAGMPRAHQPILGELPVLVAISPESLAAVVAIFICITYGSVVFLEGHNS